MKNGITSKLKKVLNLFVPVFWLCILVFPLSAEGPFDLFTGLDEAKETRLYEDSGDYNTTGVNFSYGRYLNNLFSPLYYHEYGMQSSMIRIHEFQECYERRSVVRNSNWFTPSVQTPKEQSVDIIEMLLNGSIPYSTNTHMDYHLLFPLPVEDFRLGIGGALGYRQNTQYYTNLVNIGGDFSTAIDLGVALEMEISLNEELKCGGSFRYGLVGLRLDMHGYSRYATLPLTLTHPLNSLNTEFYAYCDLFTLDELTYRLYYRNTTDWFADSFSVTQSIDSIGLEMSYRVFVPVEEETDEN